MPLSRLMIKTNKNTARYSIAPTPVAYRKQVIRSESGIAAATYHQQHPRHQRRALGRATHLQREHRVLRRRHARLHQQHEVEERVGGDEAGGRRGGEEGGGRERRARRAADRHQLRHPVAQAPSPSRAAAAPSRRRPGRASRRGRGAPRAVRLAKVCGHE